ncbi:MAG: LacI family transcriptional regulator [Chloroflexi bacterium]|nr:LacI family transcriptional regulator [Chloroflexota bacterium]
MSISIRDVAQRAGVSVSTASRALNDKPDVARDVRERVLQAARDLNYTINVHARALVGGRSKTLGLIIPDSAEPFFAQVARGVTDAATRHGYSIIVCNTNEQAAPELQAHHMLREKRVDGLLTSSVQSGSAPVRRFLAEGIPCVLLNRCLADLVVDCVLSDYRQGALDATAHLYSLGHRDIAHLTWRDDRYSVRERVAGYREALEAHGLLFDPTRVLRTTPDADAIYQFVRTELVSLRPPPTAVFVYNDRFSVIVLKALHDAGWRVPEDAALVGYDDLEFARFLEPPLTTVAQRPYDIGQTGAEILLERLQWPEEQPWAPRRVVLRPELRVRASSGVR